MGLNLANTQLVESPPAHDLSHNLLFVRNKTASHSSTMRMAICRKDPALLHHRAPYGYIHRRLDPVPI